MKYYQGIEEPWKLFNSTEENWRDPKWQRDNAIEDPSTLAKFIHLTINQVKMMDTAIRKGKPMRLLPYTISLMEDNPTNVDSEGKSIDDSVNSIFVEAASTPAHHSFPAGKKDPMNEGSRSLDSAYQRYVGTVAFMSSPSSICHLFCTHCQRDKDKGSTKSAKKGDNALEYIAQNENAREILITGGDALALGKDQLEYILKTLSSIKHVESIRIASRLPVTNPFAVTYEKLEMIARYSKHAPGNSNDLPNIYFVTHANAPEQLTEDMQDSVSRIIQYPFSGIFNQTVLLNGVNDDFSRISKLFQGLHNMGVKPYYLFQCHKVEGLATQIVPIYLGQSFIAQLRGQPGMSIPAYVVNMVGGGGKVPLTPEGNGEIEIFEYEQSKLLRGHDGEIKRYEDLLKVRERDYGEGMAAMAEFYGDPSIRDCTEGPSVNGLNTRETVSRKFRPSIIVVSDTNPDQVLYVTNVPTKTFMAQADKYKAMGFVPNGPEFGLEEKFPTNPHHAILK